MSGSSLSSVSRTAGTLWNLLIARIDQWRRPPKHFSDDEAASVGLRSIRSAARRVFRQGRYRHVSVLTTDATVAHIAVLFVPGSGGQAEQFYEQARLFLEGSELRNAVGVFYSHHGHGPNARERYSWEDLSAAALAEQAVDMYEYALDQIAPANRERAKVVIAAHSYGCAITAHALRKMPRVAGIVMMAPPIPQHRGWARWLLLHLPSWCMDLLRILDRRGGVQSKSVRRMVGWNGRGADPTLSRLQLRWNASVPSKVVKAIARQADIPTGIEYGALLRSSGAAVRFVVGEHDQLTPASYSFRIFGSSGPKAKLTVIEGDVGHQVMAERGEAVNQLLLEIFRELSED